MAVTKTGNPKKMAKWTDHRQAVKESLKRRGKSIYWLQGQVAGKMSRNLLYTYLRGECGISPENMQALNAVMGLRFTDE